MTQVNFDTFMAPRLERVTLLPDPEPSERLFTVVSVDDHLVEPPDTFEDRMPAKLAELAPKVVETDDGGQVWLYDGKLIPIRSGNAAAGRPRDELGAAAVRFDEMRRGAWDIDARIADMDLDGVYASLCFPSFLGGFAGPRLTMKPENEELGFAVMRAYNQWYREAWAGAYPDRMIPLQLPWLRDPVVAAEEIRRNAALGVRTVSFPDCPDNLGLPSLHSAYWDPFFAACEETETVLSLHVGSGGSTTVSSPEAPFMSIEALFCASALVTAVDWLYSMTAAKFPAIRIALSEGGISWVPGLLDRLDHDIRKGPTRGNPFIGMDITPAEMLKRNFWFCTLDDITAFRLRDRTGVENIMVEVDYPHMDGSWPFTQDLLTQEMAGIPADEVRLMTWENASRLYRHPVPDEVVQAARGGR
jgi:predicted TIM-barrel fold metal-dependent hydrolase